MAKRKTISKKVRFEVFKRDSFKCQYCGESAPDVVLHVDHIMPVSKGGGNEIINLITACDSCNGGKGATELDDSAAIEKQRAQLEALNERREQLEMMLKWREGLDAVDDIAINAIADKWADLVPGYHLNDAGLREVKTLLKKYGLSDVLDAVDTSASQYVRYDGDEPTRESVETAWKKVGGICRMKGQPEHMRDLFYVRGILRNRLHYLNERTCIDLLKEAHAAGVDPETLKQVAKSVRNWTMWQREMYELIDDMGGQ